MAELPPSSCCCYAVLAESLSILWKMSTHRPLRPHAPGAVRSFFALIALGSCCREAHKGTLARSIYRRGVCAHAFDTTTLLLAMVRIGHSGTNILEAE